MKTTYAIASFLAAAAGAAGAGAALNLAQMTGSDTLLTVTQQLLVQAKGGAGIAGITYVGGGSGTGESSMKAGTQQTAPMSRFFKAGATQPVCSVVAPNGSQTSAEGLVFALDGVSVIGHDDVITNNFAPAPGDAGYAPGCGNYNGVQTDAAKRSDLGLRHDGTFTWPTFWSTDPHNTDPVNHVSTDGCSYVTYNQTQVQVPGGTYKFLDWQDVLKVLLAGTFHAYSANAAAGTDAATPVRWALIANWGSIWEDQADSNCPTGQCKCIHHILRRDDWSGTTDTIVSLLGLTSIPATHATDPFANSLQSAAVANNPSGVPALNLPYMQQQPLPNDQDFDPIRNLCVGNGGALGDDVVCEGDGTLGVELVIEPSSDLTLAAAFPTSAAAGKINFAPAPVNVNGSPLNFCPNGDQVVFGNECFFPVDNAGSFANLTLKPTCPAFTFPASPGHPSYVPAGGLDCRNYNLALHTPTGALQLGSNKLGIQNAFYRNWGPIQGTAPGANDCHNTDATQQIGCVIGSIAREKCSIGYAGLLATIQLHADAIRLDGMLPLPTNVQSFAYPASRKLYFNTLLGFGAVQSPELDLAKAFASDPALLSAGGIIDVNGFVRLPAGSAPNNGQPYAEDFNEVANCGHAAPNTDATLGNAAVGLPTASTTCGVPAAGALSVAVEAYERCDDGASNGTAGSNCTATCVCAKGGVGTTGLCCFRYDVPGFGGTLVSTGLNGCAAAGTAYPTAP
jgi:hypothetical protein